VSVSLIAAVGQGGVIGLNQTLPWHCPQDFRHFKATTEGHAIFMGRKTYESLGKPLENRLNIVVTRDPNFKPAPEVVLAQSIRQAISLGQLYSPTVYCIGGGEIFEQTLPLAARLVISKIAYTGEGDTYFPDISEKEWHGLCFQTEACTKAGSSQAEFEVWEYTRFRPFEPVIS
jgi:dihydrofolate reductase